jgi:LDH2 family malate/lactate/ureidoglycolate dehydrogenase
VTRLYPHEMMAELAGALFRAVGAPADEAAITADHLVTSSLMGCDSHGIIRIPEYLAQVVDETIVPGAPIVIDHRSGATALVDCGRNFGPVGATRAMEVAISIARESGVACVTTRRCNHVARLGAYAEQAAGHGLITIATCHSPIGGHFVLPWGGKQGRLGTNPIAYGVPTGGGPIVADFATSVAPEGKVRWYRNSGIPLPTGCIQDADGRPSTDPHAFYGPPPGGLLPLGGPVGYKGFALSLLVEILGSALAGIRSTDESVVGNGVCFLAIDPARFVPIDQFRSLTDELSAYIKSSPPTDEAGEVLLPGERELRTERARLEEGVPIDDATRDALLSHAERLGVDCGAVMAT